jgi:hypothetical protein
MAIPHDPKATDTQVQHRQPQPILSVRASVPVAELAAAQGETLRALWNHLQQRGVRPAGPPYVRYHSFGETDTDMEVGIPVAAGAVGQGRVAADQLPGGSVVSAWPWAPTIAWARPTTACRPGSRPTATSPPARAGRRTTGLTWTRSPTPPAGRTRRTGAPQLVQPVRDAFLAKLEALARPWSATSSDATSKPAKAPTPPPRAM